MRELIININRDDEAKEIADKVEKNILVCEWSDKLSREDKIELYETVFDAVRQVVSKESVKFINVE